MNLRNTEPTQVVKALAIKPDDLGLIPSISTVAGEPTSSTSTHVALPSTQKIRAILK